MKLWRKKYRENKKINAAPFNIPIPNNDQLFQFQQVLRTLNPNGKRLQLRQAGETEGSRLKKERKMLSRCLSLVLAQMVGILRREL